MSSIATSPPEGERVFFPNLDGLRFLAFLLVYLQHGYGVPEVGGAGVAFFFVLSGFLITYLLLVEVDRRGRVDVIAFYVRRALRIWPLYFAVLTFAFLVYPALKTLAGLPGDLPRGSPALYVFFLANFDVIRMAGAGAGFTNVLWSVSVEEQFYVLWPLLLWVVPPRRFFALFLAVIAGSSTFRALHATEGPTLYFHSFSVVSDMAIGGLGAHVWRQFPRFRAAFTALPKLAIATGYVLGAWFFWMESPWTSYGRLAAGLVFLFIVMEQTFCLNSLFKMSRSAFLSEMGRYTYGLYMIHMIVLSFVGKALALYHVDTADPVSRWLWPSTGLLITILVAKASFLYFEAPFLRLKGRFSRISPAPRAGVAAEASN